MDKEFVAEMKARLLELKEEIRDHLAAEDAQFRSILEEEENHKDMGDDASAVVDKKMLEILGAKEQQRLMQINEALYRIENGRYGVCLGCGVKISKERLRAIPYATLCVRCKASEERKRH